MAERDICIDDPGTWPASARDYFHRWQRDRQGRPELEDVIRQRIRRHGAITFAEFMALALYDPSHGYYRTNPARMAPGGDYLTSPETHPAFGFLVGRWLWDAWQRMGAPPDWQVLEAGAGTGRLADQILSAAAWFDAAFAAALRYTIVEPDAAARSAQQQLLALHDARVTWAEAIERVPAGSVVGCVLSNELLDALPVHRVVYRDGTLQELWVVEREGVLIEAPGSLSRADLPEYFRRHGFQPPPGVVVEVNLEALEWVRRAARCLERGYLLTFDYGGTAVELYLERRWGTLRAYCRHALSANPFERIGEQDLTADVDFTALIDVGGEAGLVKQELTTQATFLSRLAWEEWRGGTPVGFPDAATRPGALAELVDTEELGGILVLVQEKTG
jgi:SAM-dependent MidA family methyltransferase